MNQVLDRKVSKFRNKQNSINVPAGHGYKSKAHSREIMSRRDISWVEKFRCRRFNRFSKATKQTTSNKSITVHCTGISEYEWEL